MCLFTVVGLANREFVDYCGQIYVCSRGNERTMSDALVLAQEEGRLLLEQRKGVRIFGFTLISFDPEILCCLMEGVTSIPVSKGSRYCATVQGIFRSRDI